MVGQPRGGAISSKPYCSITALKGWSPNLRHDLSFQGISAGFFNRKCRLEEEAAPTLAGFPGFYTTLGEEQARLEEQEAGGGAPGSCCLASGWAWVLVAGQGIDSGMGGWRMDCKAVCTSYISGT